MKLSAAQEKLLNEFKEEIDEARACETYDEYFVKYCAPYLNHHYDTPEKYKARDPKGWNGQVERWNQKKNGILLTHCNSRTLKKLESFGLIEILYDSTGENFGVDEIRVINY